MKPRILPGASRNQPDPRGADAENEKSITMSKLSKLTWNRSLSREEHPATTDESLFNLGPAAQGAVIEDKDGKLPGVGLPRTFDEIAQAICDLHRMKNADYGDSAYESYKEFGLVSYVQRIGDKYRRIKNLTLNPGDRKVKSESIEDTFMDLAAYSIMALEAMRR